MQIGQEIGHGLRFNLKTRHRRCFAADDLMHKLGVLVLIRYTDQLRSHESLSGQAMAAGAIDAKQLSTMINRSRQLQACLNVGIALGTAQDPDRQDNAGGCGEHDQGCDQTATLIWLFRCSW